MRTLIGCALAAWACAGPASAHAGGAPVGPADWPHHWTFDPWILAPLVLGHWLYGRGVLRAWARAGAGRIVTRGQVWCFAGGEALLVVALVSPLDALGETLLLAHMLQHIVLTTLAPPLLVLGAPMTAWLWALPRSWRGQVRRAPVRWLRALGDRLSRPGMATALHALALWAWHAPALFEAALADEGVHTGEHVSFLVTALLFWRAALSRRNAPALGALCVLATFVHSGMLGGVLSLAPSPLYPAYGGVAALWGLTALEDQHLAGLTMWGPAGLVYLCAFLALMSGALTPGALTSGALGLRGGESAGIMRESTSSLSMK